MLQVNGRDCKLFSEIFFRTGKGNGGVTGGKGGEQARQKRTGLLSGRPASVSKKSFGLFRQFLQSAARIIGSPMANKFHTCSRIGILHQVHAPVQKDSDFVFRLREKFCEAFSTV